MSSSRASVGSTGHPRHNNHNASSHQSQGSLPKGTGSAFYQSSLERKLELLEARFSQPLAPPFSPAAASDTATLQPFSSPNWNTTSNSQHSFAFDSPTKASSRNAPRSRSPFLQVRSKRSTSPRPGSALEQVRMAADRHMQKVAALTTTTTTSTSQRFVVASSSCSEVSSESTRLANNRRKDAMMEEPQAPSTPSDSAQLKKRKSLPMKREEPSVKENFQNKADKDKKTRAKRNQTQRKLNGDGPTEASASTKGAEKSTNGEEKTSTPPLKGPKTQRMLSVKDSDGAIDISEPVRQRTPLKDASRSPRRSRSASREPLADNNKQPRLTRSSQQRSVQNNASIHDFFSNAPSKKRRKTNNNPQSTETNNNSKATAKPPTTKQTIKSHGSISNATTIASPDPLLQKRVDELEQTCRDQEEQLKAVANNRTILHTALQSALDQREKELNQVKEQQAAWETRSRNVLEEFVRVEATRTARQVRERLAADGARLGRIVYTRGGIRSAAVETWEEGHAIRHLSSRQAELREKRKRLEERYRLAQQVAQKWLSNEENAKDTSVVDGTAGNEQNKEEENVEEVDGIPIRSKMDAVEAVESVRYHLDDMRRKERELMAEEQTLNDEKGAHIRALKRVASEDASRFRSCPKLHERYVLKCLLGKGGFSEVWRAFDLRELREVAVKIHQLDPRWSESKKENYTKHVSREYEIHRNARHPRIVSLFDVFEIDNNSFATVLELCEGTDLDAILKEKRRLVERDARAILLQILSGMQYLCQPSEDEERQGIIHYDLKPGNILFDEFGDAKITDFGLSKIVEDNDPAQSMELTSQGAGTYWYLPPECFVTDETARISNKVDVWSIGVIFYQMLFGRRPFGDGQSQDCILSNRTMLNAREVTFPEKPPVTDECKAFIRKCLAYDQAFRPTIAQLCQQPYVTK